MAPYCRYRAVGGLFHELHLEMGEVAGIEVRLASTAGPHGAHLVEDIAPFGVGVETIRGPNASCQPNWADAAAIALAITML